jgi:hypothetical protein
MNIEIKILDIYSDNHELESDYLPLIFVKNHSQKDAVERYIFKKAEIFFREIISINDSSFDVKQNYIPYSRMITDIDFKKKQIKYFYDTLFDNLGNRDFNKKLIISPKWGITFDEKCCPILTSYLSPNYKRSNERRSSKSIDYKPLNYHNKYSGDFPFHRYGTIDINQKSIFYYVYFTLQEILDEVRKCS